MTTSPETLRVRPSFGWLLRHPVCFLAFGFGSGLASKAPGTWGTLAAFPLFFALRALGVDGIALAWLCLPLFIAGIWFCEVAGRALGVHDYGGIVWDEIVAMLLVLAFAPATPVAWLLAFGLFRLFDIVKPWPIRWLDRHVHGGFGVMVDDLLAAVFALALQWLVWQMI